MHVHMHVYIYLPLLFHALLSKVHNPALCSSCQASLAPALFPLSRNHLFSFRALSVLSVQVTVVHGHRVCVGQVGHPGIVLECPSNCGTQNTQRQGVCGASWTSRDSPGVSSNYVSYTGHVLECLHAG